MIGRLVAVVALAATVVIVAFAIIFTYGSSPVALLWIPAGCAAVIVAAGLLPGRNARSSRRRWVDGISAALLIGVVFGAAAWVNGWLARRPAATADPAMAADGYVATRDGAIFYHQSAPAGTDRPVLLVLHGGPGSGSVSLRAALADDLDAPFRTIYFDQRDVGRSTPAMSFSIDDYLDDIERLRLGLKVDSWFLFGVSWGAALADEYALRHPQAVRGVVTWGGLVANEPVSRSLLRELQAFYTANSDAGGVAWAGQLSAQRSPFTRVQSLRIMNAVNRARLKTVRSREAEVESVVAGRTRAVREWGYRAGETGTSLWATAATFMQVRLEAYDFRPQLPQLRMPYLFLAGERDPLLKWSGVAEQARTMRDARLERIPDCGHTLDRPHAIAGAIVAFVRTASVDAELDATRR